MKKVCYGLVGQNIVHSRSPEIFARIFDRFHMEGTFSLFDYSTDELPNIIPQLSRLDGFSVTIPHKQTIMKFLDTMAPEAASIAAVNSVKVFNGRMEGYNTDWTGFLFGLEGAVHSAKKVLVIGYGGAARAVLYALLRTMSDGEVSVLARDIAKATNLLSCYLIGKSAKVTLNILRPNQLSCDESFDLIINCTPVGEGNQRENSPLSRDFLFCGNPSVYDLVYHPPLTTFLADAQRAGCRIINGLPMLVSQAVESYRLWSGDITDVGELTADILRSMLESESKGKR